MPIGNESSLSKALHVSMSNAYVFIDGMKRRLAPKVHSDNTKKVEFVKKFLGAISEGGLSLNEVEHGRGDVFLLNKVSRTISSFYINAEQKFPSLIDDKFKEFFNKFMHEMKVCKELLSGRSQVANAAPYEERFIKTRNKLSVKLHEMKKFVDLTENDFRKESSKAINNIANYINASDKNVIIPLIVELSNLSAAVPQSLVSLRKEILQIIQRAKEWKSDCKSRITQLYNRKLQEERNAYKESLYKGKGGEFNRNAGFSERGRFGGLDIDSRPRLDRAIKRYIDRQVRAYVKRIIKSR